MGSWRNKAAWGVAIGVLVGSSVASAAIPDTDGTIHGCVNDAAGVVRVVDRAKSGSLASCITTGPRLLQETPITWNQARPPGPQGEPGFDAITRHSTNSPALAIPASGRTIDVFVFC